MVNYFGVHGSNLKSIVSSSTWGFSRAFHRVVQIMNSSLNVFWMTISTNLKFHLLIAWHGNKVSIQFSFPWIHNRRRDLQHVSGMQRIDIYEGWSNKHITTDSLLNKNDVLPSNKVAAR